MNLLAQHLPVVCFFLLTSLEAEAVNQSWDSGGGVDREWTNPLNWGGDNPDTVPTSADSATISNGGTALYSAASGTNAVKQTTVGGGSVLNITGGKLSSTQSGNTVRNNVGSGSSGTVNQSGGTQVVAHMLRVGSGSGGNGTYTLSGGALEVTRGGSSGVSASSTSIDLGVGGGTGLLTVSGGSLITRTGVGIGSGGRFRIEGGAASLINIGSSGSGDGHWEQDAGGVLDLQFTTNGLTPLFIDYVDGTGAGGDVTFAGGSLLDVGFLGGLNSFGIWDVMHWEGTLADNGLALAPGVDSNRWNFSFADTTGSGQPDTLRIESEVESNGTWSDAASADVSWADLSKWSGGTAAYGAGKTAYFDALNHLNGPVVDLPTDIVIGTIRYRDNGAVNRSMTIESANGSRLEMAAGGSTPLIWARNRDITVNVAVVGTNGLALEADQSGRGVNLKQRNSYSGTTVIRDAAGTVKTTFPGDFGDSDLLLVKGDAADTQADLSVDHGGVLKPTASLTIEAGATVNLNFTGAVDGAADPADLFVSSLNLGGVAQPEGVYSAATHPAWFTGPGEVVVEPAGRGPELQWGFNALGERELSWPGRSGRLYDVEESSNLVSMVWNRLMTVPAVVPTNSVNLGAASRDAAFNRVVERPDYVAASRAGVVAKIDELIASNYLPDQNLTAGDIRHGQFHSSDNMRMSECTPVLVWAYLQPDSAWYQDPEVLNRAIWSVDYMCRAQGSNGGFNEYHGWCGVPNRTAGKSSVVGFTLHALGNAIELMAGLPEMQPRLLEYMDPNGTASNDTQRVVAWKNMLSQAMPFQFSGSGRGHAPNQDLCALMGVYAVNGAYAALDGGTLLKTQAEIDGLANEIFYGHPAAAADRPNGQWFSSTGMLGEGGHGGYGYDGNYGVKVCIRYLGVLAPHDSTAAAFLSTRFAEALQYFFVPDNAAPLGIFAENGIARRSTGDPMDPTMSVIGNAVGCHPALDRLYDIMLPRFAAAPTANINFSSPSQFQIGVWGWCEWIDKISEPVDTAYRLPAEQEAPFEFRDPTMKLLVTKPQGGVPVYYTEPWDTADQARRHVTGRPAETVGSLYEF